MVKEYGQGIWSRNIVKEYDQGIWSRNMVKEYGQGIWSRNMVKEYGQGIWSRNMVKHCVATVDVISLVVIGCYTVFSGKGRINELVDVPTSGNNNIIRCCFVYGYVIKVRVQQKLFT